MARAAAQVQANVGDISFSKYMDKSTPVLYKALLDGKHFGNRARSPFAR